jgi:hypothetical protein
MIGAAVSLFAPVSQAQQVTMGAPLGAAPSSAPIPPLGPPPAAPPQVGAQAPVREDPPYNPLEHDGLAYGAWLRATRGTARRSTSMMITGISLATLGVTLLAAGTGIYAGGGTCADTPGPIGSNGNALFLCGPQAGLTAGIALMASGLIGLGIGLPLTFLGAAEVPRAEAGSVTGPASPRPTVALGFTGGALDPRATIVLRF